MDTSHSAPVDAPTPSRQGTVRELSELFGSYKAEWLRDKLFELFTEPLYFPELTTGRPCMLVGGRGTGKTTVLQCLSYQGRFALANSNPTCLKSWDYVGIYYRVNTNRVTAFQGPELDQRDWVRHFAHYLNLLLCESLLRFVEWYEVASGHLCTIDSAQLTPVCEALHLGGATDHRELLGAVATEKSKFEAYINNVADGDGPRLSMQGAPVDCLVSAMRSVPEFREIGFFFLLDEYENFLDYQQQVVNTLIKHSGSLFTFKVGVRELGWRKRTTLNEAEQLVSPADYVRIGIGERLDHSKFRKFAASVCDSRLQRLSEPPDAGSVELLLPGLSERQEADALGLAEAARRIREGLAPDMRAICADIDDFELYFHWQWASSHGEDLLPYLRAVASGESKLRQRFENYRYAMLFTLRDGKAGIRKHYAGFDTFCYLANGNIRYLLELVEFSLRTSVDDDGHIAVATFDDQTRAAQAVGRKNLTELEGLSVLGAQLTKLLLGLGRIFGVLAASPMGRRPEVNQFKVSSVAVDDETADRVETLLTTAVMHLALVRSTGNKLADEGDTMAWDYTVHPIFAPFFVYSFRRKRRLDLRPTDLLGLVHTPHATIRGILSRKVDGGAHDVVEEELPAQLDLFRSYYQ